VIPQDFIQQLLARVDIVDVVGRHVKLKRAGANFLGLCPFHGEKSPSFTVSPTKQFYHCFGCGAHGSAIGFLMEHAGQGYVDAIRDLAREAGMTVPESRDIDPVAAAAAASESQSLLAILETAARHYRQRLRDTPRAIDYLKGRGLAGETAAQFGIGYAPAQWRGLEAAVPDYSAPVMATAGLVIESPVDDTSAGISGKPLDNDSGRGTPDSGGEVSVAQTPGRTRRYDRFRDRIMFPIRNPRGQVIGFGGRVLDSGEPKYMNSPETPVFSKGREIYGIFEGRDAIRREDCVVVVEGYMDVVMLSQHGVGNAVATLGTATTPDHVRKLIRLASRLVFAFDGDAAGRKAASRALAVCLPHTADTRRIDFLFLPPEHDPDSFVREQGVEGWRELLGKTAPLSEVLLRELSQQIDLGTPEGRAMLLAKARPMIAELAAPALRLQIVHRLAALAQLAVAEVERFFQPERGVRGFERGADRSMSRADGARASRGGAPTAYEGALRKPRGESAGPAKGGYRNEPPRLRVPAAAPDLEARSRLLLALHPGLAGTLDAGEAWVPAVLADWIRKIAALPPGSTFASVCEALRGSDPEEVLRLERAGGADSAGVAELSGAEAALELGGALGQLKSRWARQQIEQLVVSGVSTEEQRLRYATLLKMTRVVVK
jgi:DNA primase